MQPSYAEIETSVRSWVKGLVDVDCLPGNANVKHPADLYSTLLMVSDTQDGSSVQVDGDAVTDHQILYSLQFYGEGATEKCADMVALAESLDGPDTRDFDFFRASAPQRLDGVLSGEWEERAFTNLEVYARRRIASDPGNVGRVVIEAAVGDDVNTIRIGV